MWGLKLDFSRHLVPGRNKSRILCSGDVILYIVSICHVYNLGSIEEGFNAFLEADINIIKEFVKFPQVSRVQRLLHFLQENTLFYYCNSRKFWISLHENKIGKSQEFFQH